MEGKLTAECLASGVQGLQIHGVVGNEALLIGYRRLLPLDQDPSGLVDQDRYVRTVRWF